MYGHRRFKLPGMLNAAASATLPYGRLAPRSLVRDDAVGGRALGGGHLPLVRGGLDQHHARRRLRLCARTSFDWRTPRLPPVENSPQARLRATLWPGVGYSISTLFQSQSSSSAMSCAKAGDRALAHLGAHRADKGGVVRADRNPDGDFGRSVGRAHHAGPKGGRRSPSASPPLRRRC